MASFILLMTARLVETLNKNVNTFRGVHCFALLYHTFLRDRCIADARKSSPEIIMKTLYNACRCQYIKQLLIYRILSIKSPPPGGLFFSGPFKGGGAYWRGGLIYFLRKLYGDVPPTQRNVCKTAKYSNNFNTTLNVLRCSTINFSTIQLYICFKMFMTRMMGYVILPKMKTN